VEKWQKRAKKFAEGVLYALFQCFSIGNEGKTTSVSCGTRVSIGNEGGGSVSCGTTESRCVGIILIVSYVLNGITL
jgi:hypothetical protein